MSFKGADTKQLEQLENRVKSVNTRLDAALARDPALMATLRAVWLGPDSDHFARTWSSVDRPAVAGLKTALERLEAALRTNRTEQDLVSVGSSGIDGGAGSSSGRGPDFENRIGFSTDRSWGFIGRFGSENGYEAIFGRDGNSARYTAKDYMSIESDDLGQAIDFVATAKGKSVESPFELGISVGAFQGTQFIWEQAPGESGAELRGTAGIPVSQASFSNLLGADGYSAGDVAKDIASGKLAQPDAIAQISGVSTSAAIAFEGGGSVFGASGELSAQRAVEYWDDGRTVETLAITGTSSNEAGLHMDTPVPGLSGEIKAIAGTEATIEVSTVTALNGEPQSVSYKIIGHAEVGVEGSVGFAGGGAYENVTSGVLVERELTFDMTNPNVAEIVRHGSTNELALHSEWATEEVKVFSTESAGSGADAIIFKTDAESESMSMIDSFTREPTRSDFIQMRHDGMTPQYVQNPDGTTSKVFSAEF